MVRVSASVIELLVGVRSKLVVKPRALVVLSSLPPNRYAVWVVWFSASVVSVTRPALSRWNVVVAPKVTSVIARSRPATS